jgi:hypothetical protein
MKYLSTPLLREFQALQKPVIYKRGLFCNGFTYVSDIFQGNRNTLIVVLEQTLKYLQKASFALNYEAKKQ